jgi:hypothetical protein
MKPAVIEVNGFEEFASHVGRLPRSDWVFRGHHQTGWQIEPSLARYLRTHRLNIKDEWHDIRELSAIHKFQNAAHGFMTHLPMENDLLSWLAVMQHFGAPTRLVDFTFSPMIALFFAASGSVRPVAFGEILGDKELNDKYASYEVHAVRLRSIVRFTQRRMNLSSPPKLGHYRIGRSGWQRRSFVGFFEGKWLNPRQIAQQGLFMIPSKIDLDIHRCLEECTIRAPRQPSHWLIFRFPGGRSAYREMAKRLLSANLTHAALFPGIEGVAKSIELKWYEATTNYALTSPQETARPGSS